MSNWAEIFLLMTKTTLLALCNPFFWLVVVIVFTQYRRTVYLEKKLFGRPYNNIWRQTAYSIFYGLLGGLFGSFFLISLGISLENIGIIYLWPLALFLLLFNPRFLCFAYAGGLISVVSLAIRFLQPYWPVLGEGGLCKGIAAIHLPGLLALIGILHLTESFLIFFSGHLGSSPIYLKTPAGKVVGGYSLQRFWPLPLTGLWGQIVAENSEFLTGGVAMPDWWPLLGEVLTPGGGEQVIYLMVPLVAGLGYGDLALSRQPADKRIKTACYLAFYSIILSGLAAASIFWPVVLLPAALFAPLGHEYIIHKGNRDEFSGRPLFQADSSDGLKVMAVFPDSPAQKAGVLVGDLLLAVNGEPVGSEIEYGEALRQNYYRILFNIKRGRQILELPVNLYPLPASQTGLIFAPRRWAKTFVEIKQGSFWQKIRRRFFPGDG
ncbi:MAG: PDZ domain-containing protein [Firmicutes bacterium]|nr:PDZ domain-containing protein [Bacillota bacterium]